MTPSEDRRNALRTIMVHLTAALGIEVIPNDDQRAPSVGASTWARILVNDIDGRFSGRSSGVRRTRQDFLVTVDIFGRSNDSAQASATDALDRVASIAYSELVYASLPLKDYVTDPSGATTLAGLVIRNIQPPTPRFPPASDGYSRRMVEAPMYLHILHEV